MHKMNAIADMNDNTNVSDVKSIYGGCEPNNVAILKLIFILSKLYTYGIFQFPALLEVEQIVRYLLIVDSCRGEYS